MLLHKSNIFITGATGFLGSYIIRKLVFEGFTNLYCLRRNLSDTELVSDLSTEINWVEGDVLDISFLIDFLPKMDVIIHAAAIVSFNKGSEKKMLQTAKDGTANLVNIALESKIKKFIHISSVSALGRRREEETISEKNIFSHSQYDTTYGLSKFLAEQEVWRGHAEGLNVTVLNPSMILGAGKWDKTTPQIFKKVYEGLSYFPGGSTGWVDVRDVSLAVHYCLINDYNGERFIISAENIAYQKIFKAIAEKLSVSPPHKLLGKKIAAIAWRIETVRSFFSSHVPVVTKETIISMSAKSSFDNNKSVSILGLRYTPTEDTILECCSVFLKTYPSGINFGIL